MDRERLIPDVYAMLAATAGIGNTAITGDKLTEMPQLDGKTSDERPFATATAAYTLSANLGFDHEAATGSRSADDPAAQRHRSRCAGRPGLAGDLHGARLRVRQGLPGD